MTVPVPQQNLVEKVQPHSAPHQKWAPRQPFLTPHKGVNACEYLLQTLEKDQYDLVPSILTGEDAMRMMTDLRHLIKATFLGYINFSTLPFPKEFIFWPQVALYHGKRQDKHQQQQFLRRITERNHHIRKESLRKSSAALNQQRNPVLFGERWEQFPDPQEPLPDTKIRITRMRSDLTISRTSP